MASSSVMSTARSRLPGAVHLRLLAVASLLLAGLAFAAEAEPDPGYEYAQSVPATLLLGDIPLKGEGYEIRDEATIVNYYSRFLVQTDLGMFAVDGVDLLELRLAELPAARELAAVRGGQVMGDSAEQRLRRPFEHGAKVVSEPGETVRRLPAGVGRFMARSVRRVQKLAYRVGDAVSDGFQDADTDDHAGTPESEPAHVETVRDMGLDYIGYQRARRELAQYLRIDPYTSHPLINDRLDELAWSAWVGKKGASMLLGGVIGDSLDRALDISGDAYKLSWSSNPIDIELRNLQYLGGLGLRGKSARDFLRNGAFNPLLQTAFVDRLADSCFSTLRVELLELASEAESEREARFLLAQLAELSAAGKQGHGLPRVGLVDRTLVLDQGDGRLTVVLPVDYVGWDATAADFATRPDLLDHRPRLLVRGRLSDGAREKFIAAGWEVEEGWSALRSALAATDTAGSPWWK
jgi:hypothetical protein